MSRETTKPKPKVLRFGSSTSTINRRVRLPLADREVQFNSSGGTVGIERWTFGSGTVIWKIWPAVMFHTVASAVISALSITGVLGFSLAMPDVMMNVLGKYFISPTLSNTFSLITLDLIGIVIGFVLSYRASSGYNLYWSGRSYWSDIIRDTRTLGRLIWFHIPLRFLPLNDGGKSSPEIIETVMYEKHVALDLLIGFSVALKHYLRGMSL